MKNQIQDPTTKTQYRWSSAMKLSINSFRLKKIKNKNKNRSSGNWTGGIRCNSWISINLGSAAHREGKKSMTIAASEAPALRACLRFQSKHTRVHCVGGARKCQNTIGSGHCPAWAGRYPPASIHSVRTTVFCLWSIGTRLGQLSIRFPFRFASPRCGGSQCLCFSQSLQDKKGRQGGGEAGAGGGGRGGAEEGRDGRLKRAPVALNRRWKIFPLTLCRLR